MATKINRPTTAFAGSIGRKRTPRVKDEGYLAKIRKLPCLICGRPSEAAHVRYASYRHGKKETGVGRKPDDRWAVPMCAEHHREQHGKSEIQFWRWYGVDPLAIAALIHSALSVDDEDGALLVIAAAKELKLWRA